MHTPDQSTASAHLPLAERWRRVRAAYRYLNLATHHVLGFTVKLALLVYFLLAIVFLSLRYAVLPHIDHYKGDIEQMASHALGNAVSIERLYASWNGLRPNLFLGDVRLRDRAGRQVLWLPSVSATLSWWSVLGTGVRFESLEIIRPDLDIRRGADGKLFVAGIELDQTGKGEGQGAEWALGQHEVLIREGRLHWTDQLRGAPELELDKVNMVLRNHWNHHQFALQATPPASLAQPIDVRADFAHPRFGARAADVSTWKGELFADVRGTDLAAWKAYLDYPFEVSAGRGSVRAWLTLERAKLAGFTADVGLADVSVRLDQDAPPLELKRVSGRLAAHGSFPVGPENGPAGFGSQAHSVALTDFSLLTRDGLALAPTSMAETFTPAKGAQPEKTAISARQLNLATLAELAAQLPLSPSKRQMLADFAPRGQLRDFSAEWQGRYPALSAYRFKGDVVALGMKAQALRPAQPRTASTPAEAAIPALPGFDKLSGTVDASEKGGSVVLNAPGLVLTMPAWFAEPAMSFDQLDMTARWSFEHQDQQLLFQVASLNFVQGRLKGALSGKHLAPLTGAGGLGSVDLNGSLSGLELNKLDRYLPQQTPHDLRLWLTGALEGGVAQDVSVRLRGELAQFPFRGESAAERARGEFRVSGKIENGKLNYLPARMKEGKPVWPQAEQINGTIDFDRTRMEIKAASARTLGVALTNVKAVVPDLMASDRMLEIDGGANAPLQEFLRYLAASPVLDWIGRFTEDTHASGNARLGLKLLIPLAHGADTKVNGTLQLLGNDVVLFNELPPLQATIGKVEFSEHGVNLNGVGASFLGGPLALTGGTQRDNSIQIRLGGNLTAEGLRKTWPAPAMQRVIGHISGGARYNGAIVVREHLTQVTLDSTLAGLGLDFPAPLKKAAADSLALRFSLNGLASSEGVARDDIKVALGNTIAAHYLRQRQGKGAWNVLRGGIGVNVPAPEPDSGLTVNVDLKSLNVDQWSSIGSAVAAGPRADVRARAEGEGGDLSQYVVPDVMAARAGELIIGERKLDSVVVGASHQKGIWQASIDSHQASGYVTWNESPSGQGLGKVTARLSSLIIPESAAADVKDLLEGSKNSAAATIPALDIVAERFELFNKQLGRLELGASNAQALSGREWRINKLSLANPDGELKATGKWITKDGQSSTMLNFGIDIADAGKMLDRFGFPETLRRGKGTMSGDIAWNGLPYALDTPSLSGQIQLNLEAGQFLKKDPGAAKLLGVLSLQALPRLLKLDFHDVFSEGLAFDGITANAVITRGVLKTDNLKMHGVAATVLMDGSADIVNESTNLHVVVIPEFNLGTGPLVYALAVNPVIGLGSFLAQLFLRAPVMKALTYQMQITGPWKAPIVTKLDRGTLGDVPARKTN